MDPQVEAYVSDILETATRRYIATVLGEYEQLVGAKDKAVSDMVKDTANRAKRIMYRQITGTVVESKFD